MEILEKTDEGSLEKQKEDVKETIERMSSSELAKVQELVRNLSSCNTNASSKL